MTPKEPGLLIDLQQERLRRGMTCFHREPIHSHGEPIQTWRRKVKLAVAGVCLLGLLASLLSIAMESTDADPGEYEGEALFEDLEAGPAWLTATGGRRR